MHHANRVQRMAEARAGGMSATCYPTKRLRALAFAKHGPGMAASIYSMVQDAEAVAALAKILDQAMTECTSTDGRLDLKDVAAHVITHMRENQR